MNYTYTIDSNDKVMGRFTDAEIEDFGGDEAHKQAHLALIAGVGGKVVVSTDKHSKDKHYNGANGSFYSKAKTKDELLADKKVEILARQAEQELKDEGKLDSEGNLV